MLDILQMGIMSLVQRSELPVCTVAFPDYTAMTLMQKKKKSPNQYSCCYFDL